MPKNKYGVKCPKCGSTEVWKVGFVPSRTGRKDRFKCTVCGSTFYKGQPGTIASEPKKRGPKRKSK